MHAPPPPPLDQLALATLHNLDLRRIVPPSVLGDKALEGGSRNGREYAEADDAGRGGAYSVADCEVEVVFNAAGMREEARSGFRQMYPSACTMKERCADQPPELADAHPKRRLGDVRLRRTRDLKSVREGKGWE